MGLFSRHDKNEKIIPVYDSVESPVEEIEGPIPVGGFESLKTEESVSTPDETSALIFDDNLNASNQNDIVDNNLVVSDLKPYTTVNEFMPAYNTITEEQVVQTPNVSESIAPAALEETGEDTDYIPGGERRFIEEVKDEPLFRKKEELPPITGTTSIFNIGMISTNENDQNGNEMGGRVR